jgi:hypothetical protein
MARIIVNLEDGADAGEIVTAIYALRGVANVEEVADRRPSDREARRVLKRDAVALVRARLDEWAED